MGAPTRLPSDAPSPLHAGCADTVDIGETSYAMALADDLDGDGRTDLVVATMNGVVYCFEAAASRFHPLHAWPAQVPWAPWEWHSQPASKEQE